MDWETWWLLVFRSAIAWSPCGRHWVTYFQSCTVFAIFILCLRYKKLCKQNRVTFRKIPSLSWLLIDKSINSPRNGSNGDNSCRWRFVRDQLVISSNITLFSAKHYPERETPCQSYHVIIKISITENNYFLQRRLYLPSFFPSFLFFYLTSQNLIRLRSSFQYPTAECWDKIRYLGNPLTTGMSGSHFWALQF